MSSHSVTVQSVSALEMLKRKYTWSDDNILLNTPPDMSTLRQMPKSKEYRVPQLVLLFVDEESTAAEKANHSWLELHLGITEVAGEAGSGKTQICLGLCISCVMQTYSIQITSPLPIQPTINIRLNHESNHSSLSQSNCIQSSPQIDPYRKQNVSSNPYLSKFQKQNQAAGPSSSSFMSSSSHSTTSNSICRQPYLKISSESTHAPTLPSSNNYTNPWASNQPKCAGQISQSYSNKTGIEPSKQQFYRAIYISMGEGVSEAQRAYRLNQIQIHASRRQTLATGDLDTALSRILSRSIYNEEEFHEWLYQQLPDMLSLHNSHSTDIQTSTLDKAHEERIGVIIIDSMAGLFRIPDQIQSSSWYVRRSGLLFQAAAQLKKLSFQYHVPVVVVNQVSASEQGPSTPALGLSWSHCVNCRYLISRREEYFSSKDDEGQQQQGRTRFIRRIQLLFSPQFPSLLDCSFIIDNAGCKVK